MGSEQKFDMLMVDDELDQGKALQCVLAAKGYEFDFAPCGETALSMMAEKAYGFVLTDLMMPGMSGLELLTQIRNIHPQTEVVVITGMGDVPSAVKAMGLGAFSYLEKGVPIDDIVAEIRKVARVRKCRATIPDNAPLPDYTLKEIGVGHEAIPLKELRRRAEIAHINAILERVGGNKTKAAEILGITYRQLYNKLSES